MMTSHDMDPDVVRWGLHLLDVCTFPHGRSPGVVTRCDRDLSQVHYVREGFYEYSNVEHDEAVARAYQEELSHLDSMESSGRMNFENEQARASVDAQDWLSSSNRSYNFGDESYQNPVDESCHMKRAEDCGPSERENDEHEVGVFGSSSRSGEMPIISDEMWRSLEISDESSLDGEVGKRLNQMVPIPHVPKTNKNIPSDDEEVSDHQRLLDRLQLYELIESKVDGDGNCQFRALSDQLYRSPNLHKFVREQVVQQLKSDPDLYAGYVPMAYSEYLKKMSKYATMCTYAVMLWQYGFVEVLMFADSFMYEFFRSGEWGDHVTLQAAADWYGVKIFVITSFKDTCYIEILPQIQKSTRIIFLSFWAEVHYNSIYPEGEMPSSYLKKKKRWWNFGV